MLDQLLIYVGDRVDIELSFNRLCEIFFFPMAWLIGVDGEDCTEVAQLLGVKIFANEFVAYERLAFSPDINISARSYYIASYALCGFSNMGSIGIQLGGLTPLAPNQGHKLAKLVVSAMIAGNTACLITVGGQLALCCSFFLNRSTQISQPLVCCQNVLVHRLALLESFMKVTKNVTVGWIVSSLICCLYWGREGKTKQKSIHVCGRFS